MKSYNASKGKSGENGAGKCPQSLAFMRCINLFAVCSAEVIQTKPSAAANGAAVSMSQAAAQSAIKKPASDSLSPFSSDAEDEKPRKFCNSINFDD